MASQVCFKKALELSSLTFEMTGIRGKRTKFQQNDLAQLFLKVNKVTTAETTAQVDQVKPETNGTEHTQWTYANSELDPKLMPKVTPIPSFSLFRNQLHIKSCGVWCVVDFRIWL